MSVNIPVTSKPRLVIVGGGFAGIELAKRLRHLDLQVVLIDKNNYHAFQPLLYQVATAALEPESIAYPFREIFKHQENLVFRMAEVKGVNPAGNTVQTSIGDISYEYLVLATGSRVNYFGMQDFEKNSFPMKTIPQAMELRNLFLENFEKALLTASLEEREGLMNVVVVGGGPTGVETAGALGELKFHVLPHDYPELDLGRMQIHVVDMEDRLLKTMSLEASRSAENFLKKFNVNLWLKTKVHSYDGRVLTLSNGKAIRSDTVIWAAGVKGSALPGIKPESVLPNGRMKVDAFSRIAGYENIFVVGDAAAMITDKFPNGHPMLAPIAISQARHLADNIKRLLAKIPLKPYAYKNIGTMATIGRNHAVVDFNLLKFQGVFAWFVWLFVHLMALVGFRNKVIAFVNWAWNYFSYDRGLRFILRPPQKDNILP